MFISRHCVYFFLYTWWLMVTTSASTIHNETRSSSFDAESSDQSFSFSEKLSKVNDLPHHPHFGYLNHASLFHKLQQQGAPLSLFPSATAAAASPPPQHQQHSPSQQSTSDGPMKQLQSSGDWIQSTRPFPAFEKSETLLDRTLTQAKYNSLAAKLSKLIFVFFLESFLYQLYGVELTDWINENIKWNSTLINVTRVNVHIALVRRNKKEKEKNNNKLLLTMLQVAQRKSKVFFLPLQSTENALAKLEMRLIQLHRLFLFLLPCNFAPSHFDHFSSSSSLILVHWVSSISSLLSL